MNKIKTVLISDFDGTISRQDFFYMVTNELLKDKEDALKPWRDYLDGKIKHIDALTGIFSQIHLTDEELDKFISKIEIDKYFYDTVKFCCANGIPVYICSAGTKYYIKKRIPDILKSYKITLISNDAVYSREKGMTLIPPPENAFFYHPNTGISKEALVLKLKEEGYFTVYAGDGKPDFKSSKIADAVFAKDILLEMCKTNNIKTEKFDNFNDILEYLRRIYEK